MLVKLNLKIAVKCSHCGEYKLVDLNLFKLRNKKEFNCKCGCRILKAYIIKGELITELNCIACENTHVYKFKLAELVKQPLNIIGCPEVGMEIAFLGQEGYVKEFVDRSTNDVFELLKTLGLGSKRRNRIAKTK